MDDNNNNSNNNDPSSIEQQEQRRRQELHWERAAWLGSILLVLLLVQRALEPDAATNSTSTTVRIRKTTTTSNATVTSDAASSLVSIPLPSPLELPINPESPLASEELQIWHAPDVRTLYVSWRLMHQEEAPTQSHRRQCRRPFLWARLMGKDIHMLTHWETVIEQDEEQQEDATVTSFAVYPNYLESSFYYVEMLLLFCNRWDWRSDFRLTCPENIFHHRLTQIGAGITVTTSKTSNPNGDDSSLFPPPPARWVRLPEVPEKPILTRVQPPACRRENQTLLFRCHVYVDPEPLEESFDLEWYSGTEYHRVLTQFPTLTAALEEQQQKQQQATNTTTNIAAATPSPTTTTTTTLCLMGASHSRKMKPMLLSVLPDTEQYQFQVLHIQVQYPEQFVPRKLDRCDVILVGIGQWPAGWHHNEPMLIEKYQEQMALVLQQLLDYQLQYKYPWKVFVRSVHYNPLGDKISACPPEDWRSPLVIQQYNVALQQVCATMSVPFVDTNFIIEPKWDSAPDWCHFENKAGRHEAHYLGAVLLGLVPPYQPTTTVQQQLQR